MHLAKCIGGSSNSALFMTSKILVHGSPNGVAT